MTTRREFLAAAAWLPSRAAAQNPAELRFCLRSEPRTFHPALVTDESSDTVRHLTGGVLIRLNRQTRRLEPELAAAWRAAPDARSISFRLRTGLAFSDGTPFSAEDVAHTFSVLMDPQTRSPIADSFRPNSARVRVEVRDPHNVTVVFQDPIGGVERLFDQVVILSSRSPLKERAVLGPFLISEHKPGVYVLLRRNPHYWKKDAHGRNLPYLDSVRLEIQSNRDAELLRFRRGQVHLINSLEPDHFDRLAAESLPGLIDAGTSLDAEFLWFNQAPQAPIPDFRKAWFTSTNFRRAVSEAVHREDLARVVYRGRATPAAGPCSPANHFWYNRKLGPHPYDPQAALRRLAGDGFQFRDGSLFDRQGNPVEFSLVTNAGNRSRERMAAMLQADLRKIGIKLNVVLLDFSSLIERIGRTLQYEACLLGFVNVDLDPNAQMNVWLSSAPQHAWNPSQLKPATAWEAQLDHLMRSQAAESDPKKRKAHFDKVQEIVWEEAPIIYLLHKNVLAAVSPLLKNAAPSILRPQTFWNIEWMSLDHRAALSRR